MKQKSVRIQQKRRPTLQRLAVMVRLPEEIVSQIDEHLQSRVVPLSRNNWLLEAAVEKLRRNGGGGRNGA